MKTIYRENTDRLSVADAKRLILDAVPVEKAVDVYAQVDDQGNINWDGDIECRVNEKANIPAAHLDNDFLATCNALSIQPRMKYRPVFTDYTGNVLQDAIYTIAHSEFVRLAELFGLLVVTGEAPEPEPITPSPAPVASETVEQRRARYLALFEAEERREKRGALQRVADSEKVDRSNMSKDIDKARAARDAQKRAGGGWGSQLVQDGKRMG